MNEQMIIQTVQFIKDYKTEIEVLKKQEQIIRCYGPLPEKIKDAIEIKLQELNEQR